MQRKKRLGLAELQQPSLRTSVPVFMVSRELSITSSAQTRADLVCTHHVMSVQYSRATWVQNNKTVQSLVYCPGPGIYRDNSD